jgi:hypothetical protein
MPILGQRNVIEARGETIDDRHHGVAVSDRKRSAGTKIVLYIDYQQQIIVAWPDQHSGPVCLDHRTLAQDKGTDSRNASERLFVAACCQPARGRHCSTSAMKTSDHLILPSRNIGPPLALKRSQFSCPRWLSLDFL